MILIICLDNNNGMMFNNRRQSRDSTVIKRIEDMSKNSKLWICAYSAPLFCGKVFVDEQFQTKAKEGEYCFAENTEPNLDSAEKIIIYKWNRTYPADMYFDADLKEYECISITDFKGTSHEKITELIYRIKNK